MIELNNINHNSQTHAIAQLVKDKFTSGLIGAELGIAYGGGVEAIGKLWQGVGMIHGFDTFTGHPAELSYSGMAKEAWCMNEQYRKFGVAELDYDYQRAQLDRQGLHNVTLHKGKIHEQSLQDVPCLHYAFLDLDMINPMTLAYQLVRPLIVPGGYLCLHDVVPRGHLFGLWGLYQEILAEGCWRLVKEVPDLHFVAMEKL